MKTTLSALALMASIVSIASASASDCKDSVKAIAQSNLDQVARAYGFPNADIGKVDFVKTVREPVGGVDSPLENRNIYSVEGYLYRGAYDIEVKVDESCATRAVTITEISAD